MSQRIKVLFVDDEMLYVEALAPALRRRGLEVEAVVRGEDALAALSRSDDVDVVVLDLRLPGLSGIETLEALRVRQAALPVLVLSGTADVVTSARALELGAADVLLKPCDVESLVAAIENACERAGAACTEQAHDATARAPRRGSSPRGGRPR
jgi:DNA-binding NtrC family response regulator